MNKIPRAASDYPCHASWAERLSDVQFQRAGQRPGRLTCGRTPPLPAVGPPAAGVHLAVLHAAHEPADRHLPAESAGRAPRQWSVGRALARAYRGLAAAALRRCQMVQFGRLSDRRMGGLDDRRGMFRLGRRPLPSGVISLLLAVVFAWLCASRAVAATISSSRIGVNIHGAPSNLAVAASAGLGIVRQPVAPGRDTDAQVELVAAAHLRLYATLLPPTTGSGAVDATTVAQFATSFAQRYGRGGTFWAQHPELP